MRKLLLISLLFLAGCKVSGPAFKVGDCIRFSPDKEEWETKQYDLEKVVRVGKEKYLLQDEDGYQSSSYFSLTDTVYKKEECPK